MIEAVRDPSGKFVKGKSGNLRGRPKGTGSKHKYAKSTLENKLNKMGPEALDAIMKIGKDALVSGDIGTAIKCFMYVGGKYYELTIYNDRVEVQEQKKRDAEAAESYDDEIFEAPQVSFSFTPVVVNE